MTPRLAQLPLPSLAALPLLACSPAVAIDDESPDETSAGAEDSGTSAPDGSSGGAEGTSAPGDATTSPTPSDESTTQGATEPGETGPAAVCGDGIVDGDETCDDGNEDPADGCAPGCLDEPGWVVAHHVSETVNAQFTAVDVAEDGSVLVAGAELDIFGAPVNGLVARYDTHGALLGRSQLMLDVTTYPREVVDIDGGDALVLVATGPELGSPTSRVQLLRITPGASQPAWVLDLFAGQTARAGRGLVLDGDGVLVGLSGYDDEVESVRLLRVTLDGAIDRDLDLDAATDATDRVHVMRDADAMHVMVCHMLSDASDCELRQVGVDGTLSGGIAWSVDGIVADGTIVGDTVVLAGATSDHVPAVWAWTAGEPAWTIVEERDGTYRSIAAADDGSLVVAGVMPPDDDTYERLVYRRLGLDGTVLDAPEPIADHSGFAVARRGGTSIIAGQFDYGVDLSDLLLTDGWLHSTGN